MIYFIKPWLLSYIFFTVSVMTWKVHIKGLCWLLTDGRDLCKIELSAELATFLMDHHFYLEVADQSWFFRLGHLSDAFFKMHEAQQGLVFVLSPERENCGPGKNEVSTQGPYDCMKPSSELHSVCFPGSFLRKFAKPSLLMWFVSWLIISSQYAAFPCYTCT